MRLYVNGELEETKATIAAGTNGADLEIGASALFSSHFDGLIDELRVYDVSLTQSQIKVDREEAVDVPPSA